MENFFAPPTSDGTGVTGRDEILPFSEEQNAEVFVAGGEGGGPTEGGVVFDESGGDRACIGFDGTGEMPFEEAVARRLVETLVGQPRERKEGERGGGEEPLPPTATQGKGDDGDQGDEGEHHAAVGKVAAGGEGTADDPTVTAIDRRFGGEERAEGQEDEGGAGEFGPDEDCVEEEKAGEDEGGGGGMGAVFGEAEPAEKDPERGNPEELKPDAGGGAGFVVADVERL